MSRCRYPSLREDESGPACLCNLSTMAEHDSHPGMSKTGINQLHFQFALMQKDCCEFINTISLFDAERSSSEAASPGRPEVLLGISASARHVSKSGVSAGSVAAAIFHELPLPPHIKRARTCWIGASRALLKDADRVCGYALMKHAAPAWMI